MAKKWSDVAASTAFQALSYEEQEEARRQYFEEVVAPRVPTEDIDLVRGQFLADTTIKRPQPVDNTQIDYGDAATSMQGTPQPADSRGFIARLSDALKPAPKPSVMEGFQPTPQQRQAEIDQRLKLGAGPISQQTVQQAADVRAGRAKTADPLVARVAQSMEQQNTPTIEGLIQRTNNATVQDMVRDAKADEFRSIGEWAIDTLSGLSQGAVSLPQLPINFIAPGSEIAETLRQTQKEWQAAESDVLKAQREQLRQRVQEEEGFLGKYYVTVKQMISSPALTISEAAKQVPMFLGVLGAARLGAAAAGAGVNVAGRVSPTVALSDAISGGAIQAGARAAGSTAGGVGASMVMAGGDAAGGVYEKLTDPQQTPMSVWEKNEDFQRLTAQGKTADQAIEEIATTKARMAALVTAPLGLLGFAGAEAAIASRGLGKATREALTLGGAGKLVAKDLAGEQLEEGGTQFGGNVIARTVDPKVKLTEGVPEAMGQALVTSAPFSVLGAASRAQEAAQISQPTNFTPPGSPTQRAGMVDIVIPVPDAPITIGDTNASTASQSGAAPTAGAGREDPLALGGVDVAGRDLDSAAGLPGGALGGIRAGDRQDDALRGGVPERLASLTDTSPIPRASDADLLARTEAAIAGNNNAVAQPAEQWFGRRGGGYVTEADANQALPGRKRMFPSLDWKIEQMPSGKYRLAGYSQETDFGTQAPQAQQAEAQGAQQLQAVGTAPSGTAAGAAPAQAGATLELSGAERAGLKLALPAPATTFGSVRTALAKQRGVEVDAIPVSELNDSQRVASAVGRLFGNTVTFLRATKGDPQQMPNGMVNRMGGKHIFVASNTDDAALTVTMHEAYHGLPAARRKQLNTALLETFASDRKADFQTEFGYDDVKFEEEAPAMIAQAVSKRADFWEELRTKMGNKEFGEVAKVILDKLTQIVTGAKEEYGDAFVSKYIKDVERARGLLTDAYAEAMRAQGMQADVVASDRSMNTRLQQRIDADFDAAVAEYSALPDADGGKLIDTDLVRELSPEYRADRTRAAEVHDAASDMTQRMFEARVDAAEPGNVIAFMAGGGGAGKSTAQGLLKTQLSRAHTILDGTLSSYDKARRNVQRALDRGHAVQIMYVYREPEEALRNGVLTRAMSKRRAVPLDALVKGHAGSSEVVRKLEAEFGGNPRFKVYAIDNSRGAGKAALVPLQSITPVIKSGLKERLLNATETEYQAGRIDDQIYRATLEGFPDAGAGAEAQAQDGGDRQGDQGSVQERTGSVGSRDAVDEPAMSERAGGYRYEKDNKGRITFTKDVDRVRFLARDAKPSKVDGDSITFKAEDAAKVIKALETEPKVDKSIAAAIKKKLKLTDEELASTSLEYQTGEPKDRAFVAPLKGGIPEVVKFLEDRRRASGLRLLDIANPEDQDLAAKLMAAETLAAIRSAGNALEWYDETIARTLAMAAVKYPELQSDRNAQMIFRLAMAITSQGLNVENNLKFTMRQYDAYRRTGKYPEVGEGDSAQAMTGNFKLANELIAEMGVDLFRRFLVTPFTIGELNSAGFEPGGELIDETVLGSSVFGPKIGFGFYSNLNGNFEPVTMDMWFMRTVGRLTGNLRAFDAEKFGGQIARLREALTQTGDDGVFADQFDPSLVERAATDQDAAIELARQVTRAHEKDFKVNRAAFDAKTRKKSQLVLAADTMIQSLDKPKDVPASGGERRLLREVVRKAVAQVEKAYGQRIPPAAMQALIWYPEQELYKAMGVKLSVTSQDYAGATEKVLKDEGYDEQRLRTAAESGSRGIRQANAGDAGQGAQGNGQGAGSTGPLEGQARQQFIRDRYERTQLAKERLEPKRRGVIFEVAPDPNNATLTDLWRTLDPVQRLAVSDRVARAVVPRVLAEFNTDGILAEQVGSYLDDTNPSFSLLLNKGDPVEIAKTLGFVLAQDSMMVVSPTEFKGGDKNTAIVVQVGDKTPEEVEAIYNSLREIEVNGERPIGGQSYANGGMTVLNFSEVPTAQLAVLVDQKLNKAYTVLTREVFAAFPAKQEYDYASSTNDGRGSRAVLRQRARDLRSEATGILEQELRAEGIEFSNRSDAASSGRDGGGVAEETREVVPSYGTPREGAASAVGYHYSRQQRTNLLSSAYGTGLKGAEMDRLRDADPALRSRIYFYIDRGTGINPEAGVGGFAHRVRLENLYDMDADTQRLARDNRGANAFESAVMRAGFDGYMTRDAGPSGVAVLLGKHMVRVQQLGSQTRMRTEDIVPAAERELNGAEQIAANRSLPSGQMDGPSWARMVKAIMPDVYAQYEGSPVWSTSQNMYKDGLARKLLENPTVATDAGAADVDLEFSERTKPDPVNTVKAYKLFRVDARKPGLLFPLFVDANKPVPMNTWLDADVGAGAAPTKTGKPTVKSKLGPLAYRPGWHAGDLPLATHIGGHSVKGLKAPDIRKPTEVWAEVEMAADVDWQTEANKRGINKKGKFIAKEAHITDQLPEDGYYRYKTNSNMTGNWLIGGSMKVTRILSDAEVEQINSAAGVADLPRQAPFDAARFGFANEQSESSAAGDRNSPFEVSFSNRTKMAPIEEPGQFDAKPGEEITVVRLASMPGLDNTNAASPKGLATYLSMVDDFESAAGGEAQGSDTIYVYRVKVPEGGFGSYSMQRGGAQTGAQIAGRTKAKYGGYWYSFPQGTEAALLGSIPLNQARASLSRISDEIFSARQEQGGPPYTPGSPQSGNFDFVGTKIGGQGVVRALQDAGFDFDENGVAFSERRRLPVVSPQSALDADIRRGAAAVTRAVNRLRADPSYAMSREPIVIGRLPHVLGLLNVATQDLEVTPNILNKIFVEKHASEFASVTPEQFVRALYRPAMVLQSRKLESEKELVLPITGDIGAVIVPINTASPQSRENAFVISAYQRRIVDPGDRNADTILRRINEGAVRYVDLALAKPALTGRPNEEAPTESRPGDRGDWSGDQRSGTTPSNPLATSRTSPSQMLTQGGRPFNKFFVPWPAVAPKLRTMVAEKKVKTDVDLMRWIGNNYRAEFSPQGLADTPAFSNRRQRLSVIGGRFRLPAPSMTDDARRALQDDALRMKRVIDAVRGQGGTVTEAQNFYDANTLMPGRIQAAMDDFKSQIVQPMIDKAVSYDIDLDELALYAYAKHAEERNNYIASINKRMPDGGSGMTTADANALLQQVQSGPKAQQYEELHRDLMALTSTTRQIMLAEGLITQDEFTAMDGAYQNYIPLRGLENVDDEGRVRPGVGRGVNIRGKETIRALGRRSRASDLIENAIRDYERVVMRVEKNDVGKVLLDFVLSNPDPDLWDVDVERNVAGFNKAKGVVQYTKQVEKGEDTIGVKVSGQQVYIKLADPDLARALRQAWKDETSGFERAVVAMSGWWNNWMRNMLTRYNPAFAAINIPRDALWSGTTAALAELGAKGLASYLANYPAALLQSSKSELGAQTNARYQEFRNSGGITGGFYMRGLEDIQKDLRNEMLAAGAKPRGAIERIKAARTYKLARLTLKSLEFLGAASENATRFALFAAARDVGRTPVQAALLAKNGTTNFNRKGEWGGALNNLYLFYNAAVQGTTQLVRVLRSPAVVSAMAGVAGIGAMLAFYGASAGGEDDDGEAYWDKIPGYVKERNMVIMLPPGEPLADGIKRVGKRGRYFTIPVQFGFNIFPNLGYVIADTVRNQQDPKRGLTPTKAALHMTSVTFGSINPFGGAIDVTDGVQVLMAVMPTLADLPLQLATERGTFGTPSAPTKSAFDKKPDSERMFTSQQGTVPARIAQALNELTGGNEAKEGAVSVTPGTVQTLISSTTGGLGSFIEQVGSSIMAMSGDDKDIKAAKIPFLNKFYGEVDETANIRTAGDRAREIKKVADEVKEQARVGLEPKLDDDEKRLLNLAGVADAYNAALAQMRKQEIQIIRDPKMTDAQKNLERRQIQVERDKMATEVNREYLNSLGAKP